MRMPQFTIGRLMIVVAATALILLVATSPYDHDGITDKRVVIPVACVVSAAYGLGAMRRPLVFLAPLLALWVLAPRVDHPSRDLITVSAEGCFLAWFIGAPAGWFSRHLKDAREFRADTLRRGGP